MLELAPFAKVFATGPEDPLENKYCFYCMLCTRNISKRTRRLYELKRHSNETVTFGQISVLERNIAQEKFVVAMGECYMLQSWRRNGSFIWTWMYPIWTLKGLSFMTYWKERLSHSQRKSLVCGSRSTY